MQVAVAGVPERPDPDVVLGGDPLDRAEHVRDPRARHADVLHPDVAEPLQRVVGRAPGLAQPVGLLGVGGTDDVGRAGGAAGGLGPLELVDGGDARACPIRSSASRPRPVEPEVVHVVDGRDREPVEQLEGDRREPGGGDPGDRVAGRVEGREEGQHRQARRRAPVAAGASPR